MMALKDRQTDSQSVVSDSSESEIWILSNIAIRDGDFL